MHSGRHDREKCLTCYMNVVGGFNVKGHAGYRKPKVRRVLSYWEIHMKKPERRSDDADGAEPAKGSLLCHLPNLWEFLITTRWEDGSKRDRPTLMVIIDGGSVKLWVNDRSLGRTAWFTGESLDAALGVADDQIGNESVPWRSEEGKRMKR
jgi:hypothetical protein